MLPALERTGAGSPRLGLGKLLHEGRDIAYYGSLFGPRVVQSRQRDCLRGALPSQQAANLGDVRNLPSVLI